MAKSKQKHKTKEQIVNEELTKKAIDAGVRPADRIFSNPTWKASDTFAISGMQLQDLANLANPFRPLIEAVDAVIQSGELEGIVTHSYVYEDGTPVPSEDKRLKPMIEAKDAEIKEMRKRVEEYQAQLAKLQEELKAKAKEAGAVEPESDSPLDELKTEASN